MYSLYQKFINKQKPGIKDQAILVEDILYRLLIMYNLYKKYINKQMVYI